ncbi:MAG: sporulation integral membrane protein YtvI [Firmicutes bacterium]|nr:sporulation integral membrane protein YtvI [Bacillota bacterium]
MPKPLLYIIYSFTAAVVLSYTYRYVLPVLTPFLIAVVFTLLMDPLIGFLQRRAKLSRSISTMAAMVLFFGGIGFVITLIVLKLVDELITLSAMLPEHSEELWIIYHDLVGRATEFYGTLPANVTASLEQSFANLTANLQGLISGVVNTILQFISLVPGTITILVVSLLATYFLARDRQLIVQLWLYFAPEPWGTKSVVIARQVAAAFTGYLRAQAVLVLITMLLSVAGLYLTGAKYALTVGLLVGFFDLIPVLGPATVYLPWIVWSFVDGSTAFGVKLTILYLIVLVVRQVLETKIVSANLGLHPLATLLAMYAGLKTVGIAGLVLGPILLIAALAVFKAGILPPKVK